jgi:RNA polymerase sigma-70 factor, ECF subfamily
MRHILRLVGDTTDWQNHAHFIGVAANVMRRVLVDHARAHNAAMRGAGLRRVELEEGVAFSSERSSELIAVDEALDELKKVSPRQAKVVELRLKRQKATTATLRMPNVPCVPQKASAPIR